MPQRTRKGENEFPSKLNIYTLTVSFIDSQSPSFFLVYTVVLVQVGEITKPDVYKTHKAQKMGTLSSALHYKQLESRFHTSFKR